MPPAALARNAVVVPPAQIPLNGAISITCHVAVWYYAAKQVQAQGISIVNTESTALMNICNMLHGLQQVMLNLAGERDIFLCCIRRRYAEDAQKKTPSR